jgi:thiol-disulfide isomerase/thioredoxin
MKNKLVLAMMMIPVLSLAQGFEIRAKVPGIISGSAWIELDRPKGEAAKDELPAKVRIVNGEFVLKGKLEYPGLLRLHISTKVLKVLLENTSYTVTAPFPELNEASLKGGPLNESLVKYNTSRYTAPSQYIMDYPGEAFGAWLALRFYKEDMVKLGQLYELFSAAAKASYFGKEVEKVLSAGPGVGLVGQKAPQVKLTAPDGKQFGFANYSGKYIVVDFWASWCAPCRRFIPALTKIYDSWKLQGVQFLSISLDDKEYKWKEALEDEKMPWAQGLAEKGFEEDGLKKFFHFTSIPYMVIIAPDGTVAAELDYRKKERLDNELQRLFSENK